MQPFKYIVHPDMAEMLRHSGVPEDRIIPMEQVYKGEVGVIDEGIRFITSPRVTVATLQQLRRHLAALPPAVLTVQLPAGDAIPMRPPGRLLHSAWAAAVYCYQMEQ